MEIWDMIDSVKPMGLDEFWSLVAQSRTLAKSEGLAQDESLAQLLSLHEPEQIAAFQSTFLDLSSAANRDDVHAVLGGSDDGFHYMISGLISKGKVSYEALLAHPHQFRGDPRVESFEIFEYAGSNAFEEPERSRLRAAALSREERVALGKHVPNPGTVQSAPRL